MVSYEVERELDDEGSFVIYRNRIVALDFEIHGETHDLTRDEFGTFHRKEEADKSCASLNEALVLSKVEDDYTGPYYVVDYS